MTGGYQCGGCMPLPDDARYGTSAIGDPMGLFGQPKNAPAIGNSEPGQGGASYGADPFGPSANTFVNSYEAAEEKKSSEPQPNLIERALFSPGTADASSFGANRKPFTPTSGDKMIASYEAAQGLQGEGGVLLAAARAGKTGTDARGAPNTAPGGQTPGGQPNSSPQPKQTDAERFPMRPDLGESVKHKESANGVAEVSSGLLRSGDPDPGGPSYGTYQMTSMPNGKAGGTVAEFLKSPEGKQFADKFEGLTPGSPEFNAAWKALAGNKPTELHQAEKAFLYRNNMLPGIKKAAAEGLDVNNPAVQDAVWSAVLQHGPGGFSAVLARAKANSPNFSSLSTEEQLKALYWSRSQTSDNPKNWWHLGGRYFGKDANDPGEFEIIRTLNEKYQKSRQP